MLHHTGKAGRGYRGSTAIGAAVDLGFELIRAEDDPQARTRRKLSCWKSRLAAEPEPLWLALEARDGHVTIDATEPYTGSPTTRDTDDRLEHRFATILAERGELRRAELCDIAGINPDDGHSTRALRRALSAGLIANPRRGVYTTANPSLPPCAIGAREGGMERPEGAAA